MQVRNKSERESVTSAFDGVIAALKESGFPNKHVQLFTSMDKQALSIHLHNGNGLRPTVYQILPSGKTSNSANQYLRLDTIHVGVSTPVHRCLKEKGAKGYITKLAVELASQVAEGTPEETAIKYQKIGVLYRTISTPYNQ